MVDTYYKKQATSKDIKQIVAVDGTYINILNNVKGFDIKKNKNNETITPLISGIYNVSYKCPVSLDLVTTLYGRNKSFL